MNSCQDYRIYGMGRKRFLQILKSTVEDSGVYVCDAGEASTSCTVEVYGTKDLCPYLAVVSHLTHRNLEKGFIFTLMMSLV